MLALGVGGAKLLSDGEVGLRVLMVFFCPSNLSRLSVFTTACGHYRGQHRGSHWRQERIIRSHEW